MNWSRENEQSSERASAFASIVFPTPGKSSMIRCPSATRQRTTSRSVSSDAWTTRPRFATIAPTRSAGAGATAGSAKQALHLVEDRGGDLVLRRLRDRALAARRDTSVTSLSAESKPMSVRPTSLKTNRSAFLRVELLARALEPALALVGREADEHLPGRAALAERRRGRRSSARARPSRPLRSFGRFVASASAGR